MLETRLTSPIVDPSLMAGSLPPVENRTEQLDMDLLSGRSVYLGIGTAPIYSASEIGLAPQANQHEVRVLAELALPGLEGGLQNAHVAVLQIADRRGEVRYALQGLTVDDSGRAKVSRMRPVAIELGKRTLVGSAADKSDSTGSPGVVSAKALWGKYGAYAETVSAVQLDLTPDTRGGLTISDVSKTGTGILYNKQPAAETHINPHMNQAYTLGIEAGLIDKDNKFAGHPIIDSYTTMGGKEEPKVDIASWSAKGEAAVVGPSRDSEKPAYEGLKATFTEKIAEIQKWNGGRQPAESDVLKAIASTVSDTLEYDLAFVDKVTEHLSRLSPRTRMVNLSWYLEEGKGVCRHMALAAAWLGGEARESGLLPGKTFVQGNQRRSDNAAHRWARYRDKNGEFWIIDPTLPLGKQVQRVKDAVKDPKSWYLEEAERTSQERRAKAVGNLLVTHVPGFDDVFDQEKH